MRGGNLPSQTVYEPNDSSSEPVILHCRRHAATLCCAQMYILPPCACHKSIISIAKKDKQVNSSSTTTCLLWEKKILAYLVKCIKIIIKCNATLPGGICLISVDKEIHFNCLQIRQLGKGYSPL